LVLPDFYCVEKRISLDSRLRQLRAGLLRQTRQQIRDLAHLAGEAAQTSRMNCP
jgi:hypothetical protein